MKKIRKHVETGLIALLWFGAFLVLCDETPGGTVWPRVLVTAAIAGGLAAPRLRRLAAAMRRALRERSTVSKTERRAL